MTITRDGDFWLIGGERIPATTECAGRVLTWTTAGHGRYERIRASVGTYHIAVFPNRCWAIETDAAAPGGYEVARWDGEEPTIASAQRRVLRVLAALTEKLEG